MIEAQGRRRVDRISINPCKMRVRHAALLAAAGLLRRFAFPVVARWLLPSRFVRLSEGQASGRHIGKTGRCFSRLTLGGTGVDGAERDEGSWSICMDDANLVDRMRSRECVVYSFGVRTDWSFDSAIARLGCTVHAFDPSVDHPEQLAPGVHFHPVGLSGQDGTLNGVPLSRENVRSTWNMRSLSSLAKELQHTQVDLLKIDIEGAEWDVLEQVASGELDALSIGQIVAEVHFGDSEMRGGDWKMEQREVGILQKMQGAGWALWRREDNEQGYERGRSFLRGHGSCCFDVGWIRKARSRA